MIRQRSISPGWKQKPFVDNYNIQDQSTSTIIKIWILMQPAGLFLFHRLFLHQLRYYGYGDWLGSDDAAAEWPFRVHIIETVVGWVSGIFAVLFAVLTWLVRISPGGHLRECGCPVSWKQRQLAMAEPGTDWSCCQWVPFVGPWLRREMELERTYDCDEQRRELEGYLLLQVIFLVWHLCFAFYWVRRLVATVSRYASTQPPEGDVPPFCDDWFVIDCFIGTIYAMLLYATFCWRRPKSEHARPGNCCPERPSDLAVGAWRHQSLQTQQKTKLI
ncbi:unnamed protein product, partial [Mesorhabditis spiculigera]